MRAEPTVVLLPLFYQSLAHRDVMRVLNLAYHNDTVQTIDQITECYNTTGDYDFLIKVYAHDMKDYQDFMLNTLGNIDCIGSLHSIHKLLDEFVSVLFQPNIA